MVLRVKRFLATLGKLGMEFRKTSIVLLYLGYSECPCVPQENIFYLLCMWVGNVFILYACVSVCMSFRLKLLKQLTESSFWCGDAC